MGVGVSWVQVSVHQFGVPVYLFSVTVTLFLVMGLAVFPAVAGYLTARFNGSNAALSSIMFAAAWTLLEWLRGWVLTGFPWLYAGYSQIDSPLAGYAPIGGVLAVSFIVALSGGLLVAMLTVSRRSHRVSAVLFIALLWSGGAGLQGIDWSDPAGAALRTALIQGNVPQEIKWRSEQRQPTLDLYRTLSEAYWSADIILWPETAIPAFPQEIPEFLGALGEAANISGSTVLIGMPTRFPPGERGYRNSLVAVGAVSGQYDKRHLVPFGEYLPLRPILGTVIDFLSIPMSNFSAGQQQQMPINVQGHQLGVSICYEDAFNYEVRKGFPNVALLVNISNDAWFGDSLAPHQHLELARMRAVEFSRYMLRATNTGVSAIIDHKGNIVATIPQFEAGSTIAEVVPMRGATPYAAAGNTPLVIFLLACIALSLWIRRRMGDSLQIP